MLTEHQELLYCLAKTGTNYQVDGSTVYKKPNERKLIAMESPECVVKAHLDWNLGWHMGWVRGAELLPQVENCS